MTPHDDTIPLKGRLLRFIRKRGSFLGHETSGSLSLFRAIYCLVIALEIATSSAHRDLNFQRREYDAIPVFEAISSEPIPHAAFETVRVVLLIALVLGALGVFTRPALIIAALSFLLYEGTYLGFTKPKDSDYAFHMSNLTAFALALLAAAPGVGRHGIASLLRRGESNAEVRIPEWPRRTLIGLIAIAYFGAGWCKMAESPLWVDGDTLQGYLLARAIRHDLSLPLAIASHHDLCVVLSVLTVAFELTFPLVFFFPRLALLYLPGGLLFHTMILLTMKINFFDFFASNYLVFIEWRWFTWLVRKSKDGFAAALRPLGAPQPVSLRSAFVGIALLVSLASCVFLRIESWPWSDFRVYSKRRSPETVDVPFLGRHNDDAGDATALPAHIQMQFQRALGTRLTNEIAAAIQAPADEKRSRIDALKPAIYRILDEIDPLLLRRKKPLHLFVKKPVFDVERRRFTIVVYHVSDLPPPL